MPRSKEDNERIREERIRMIKDATVRVYAMKGYLGTQMDDIAKEAGLAKGLLYYYFKNKNELFQYVFRELMDNAFRQAEKLSENPMSLKETLELFLHFLLVAAFEQPVYPLAYKMMSEDLGQVFSARSAEMEQTFVSAFSKPLVERFELAMEQGEIAEGNAYLQTRVFTSGVLSMSYLIASNPQIVAGESQEQIIAQMKRQLFYGLFYREVSE